MLKQFFFSALGCGALLTGLAMMDTAVARAAAVKSLDTTSEPAGVLSPANQKKLWNAYKIAKECFEHPNYDPGTPQQVPSHPASYFQSTPWKSPFPTSIGSPGCATSPPRPLATPDVVSTVKLDEHYGERQDSVDGAEVWFRTMDTYFRFTRDPVAKQLLHDAVLQWAKGNGLAKGIHVSWGHKPVDYQMMTAIMSILVATADVSDTFSPAERAVIGPWLNGLVAQSAASYWKDREDDKAFMKTDIALLWGIMIGDNKPIQDAITNYKLAIHDMRPDGSWPIDSQRGGMGLGYDILSTAQLIMIATLLKNAEGVDLFDYAVDGRSLHNAVDWVVAGIKAPGKTNSVYAIPCSAGGDRWGSIDKPNTYEFGTGGGALMLYASYFPDRDSSKFITSNYSSPIGHDLETVGGNMACQFATTNGKLPSLIQPLVMPTTSN